MSESAVNLNLVSMADHTYHDPAKVLRAIADGIEQGRYGGAGLEAGIVLRNSDREVLVFAGGSRSTPARTHLLFSLASRWIEDQML